MQRIVTRKEAKAVGSTLYFTGNACIHGHVAERLVRGSTCVECRRLLENRRYRARGWHLPLKKERRARGLMSTNNSGYKGVSWSEGQQLWRATIKVDGRTRHLGYFDSAERAYDVYCAAAVKAWGDDFKPAMARRKQPWRTPLVLQNSV